jgi:hypothetical protein
MFWTIMVIALFVIACLSLGAACRAADALEKMEKDLSVSLKGLSEILNGIAVLVGNRKKEIEDVGGLPFTL